MLPMIRQVKAVMKKHGIGKMPLWNTETGWWIENGDGTPDHPMVAKGGWKKLSLAPEASDYLLHALILARAAGVDRFYWYAWDNGSLGMIEATSKAPKPMVDTWRQTVARLQNASQLQCTQMSQMWRCTFVRQDGQGDQISWPIAKN
jgi:hypothetical protein